MSFRHRHRRGLASAKPGYIMLVTVLIVGAVATAVVASLLFIATNSARTALTLERSALAETYGMTCMETALSALFANGSYAGNVTQTYSRGSCEILAIGGSGNENRTVCVEAISSDVTRKWEASVSRILPSIRFSIFREIPEFTLCAS